MKKILIICIFTFSFNCLAVGDIYKSVFSDYTKIEKITIDDPISEAPVNTILKKILKGNKVLGFSRDISTTTGCNSACLPLNYVAFYNEKGMFKRLLSTEGLTKINHSPFSKEDYSRLEFLLVLAPKKLNTVGHPKEMTDAISGATLKRFQEIVVRGAAYSTLRIHLYNQHTLKKISDILKK